jgi:formamidopyrimidine-DNA glycosylase
LPELPEIESMVRMARPRVVGRGIASCRIIHPIVIRPERPKRFAARVVGRTIHAVERRGKYILFLLDSLALAFHLKLDGQFLWIPGQAPAEAHLDLLLRFDDGSSLAFVEPRHLGRARIVRGEGWESFLPPLGPDPFDHSFTADRLCHGLKKSRTPVKVWLMDQKRIAGLGNIYAAEALFRAGIRPTRRACTITAGEATVLHKAIVDTLSAALECFEMSPPDWTQAGWWFPELGELACVYGREGEPCRRCGGRIRAVKQAGRTSFYCPRCQR